jgi:hypothetical protein
LPSVPQRPSPRRPLNVVPAALVAAALGLVAAAPSAPAAAVAGPPRRAYELVSPAEKSGYDVNTGLKASPDGDAYAYWASGGFGDVNSSVFNAFYSAHRTAAGWTSASLSPTWATGSPSINNILSIADLSADVGTAYYTADGVDPLVADDQNAATDVYSASGPATTWLSPGLTLPDTGSGDARYAGRSDDGRTVVMTSARPLTGDGPAGRAAVYDRVDGVAHLVSVPPAGDPAFTTDAALGAGHAPGVPFEPADRTAVSADGSRVFFTVGGQLYARIDDRETQLVSASRRTGAVGTPSAAAPAFYGASSDGTRVVFGADAPLTDDATHGGVYLADLATGTLSLLADVDTTGGRSILGAVQTSADGLRTFFVSDAALAAGATDGQPNLYVSNPGVPAPRFVARLAAGDSGAWSAGEQGNDVAISPGGTTLAFRSARNLTGYDSAGQIEVYVYDAAADSVACASCAAAGVAATGSAELHESARAQTRNVASDGTVFFDTPEALTAGDDDGVADVYAWTAAGGARLLTPGTTAGARYVDSSRDGSDVFLRTTASLVGADVDGGAADVYDVRVGGGFPDAPAPCTGSACRGAQTPQPPAPAAPASLTATDAGGPAPAGPPATTFRLSSISAAARASWVRTGHVVLTVRLSDAAVVGVSGRATIARKRATVAGGRAGRTSAGTVHVTVTLTTAARRALTRSGRLTIALTVTVSGTTRTSHATVVLRKAIKKAAKR